MRRSLAASVLLIFSVCALACGGAVQEKPAAPPADPLAVAPPEELFERGVALAQQGDFVRAEQYLSAAVDRGYPEERALPLLVEVCLLSSRFRSALQYALPYLDRHADAWSLRYLVASVYLGIGDTAEARSHLERIVADAPDQAQPHYLLGIVHRDHLRNRDRARSHFAHYLQLSPDGPRAAEIRAALRAMALEDVPSDGGPAPSAPQTDEPAVMQEVPEPSTGDQP